MATTTPGRIQVNNDTTITSATSPITLYTVPANYTLYLDYMFLYNYAFTAGTGAAIGWQVIVDQGLSGGLAYAIARGYKLQDTFAVAFRKPIIVTANISLVALGAAGGGATFNLFNSWAGEVT